MSGIGGWIGPSGPEREETIGRIGSSLARLDGAIVASRCGEACGLASAGSEKTAALTVQGDLWMAVYGHPRSSADAARSRPPTAVCQAFLTEYRERGVDALRMLQGDFALVVVDTAQREALLAVDGSGTRSLIYQLVGTGLLFATTTDALASHPSAHRELDPQALYDYVYFHMIPGPRTALRHQHRLLPGEYATYRSGRITAGRYWAMSFDESAGGTIAELAPQLRRALREGVESTRADERCGAFLSGGTDSSTIAGLLCELSGAPARTFSIGFDVQGYDEMQYARIAARHFGTDHHEYYVTPEDVVAAVPLIAQAYDQPFGNASAVPTFFCARLAREHGVTLMLGGDGGDELFGGNSRYAKQQRLALYGRIPTSLRTGLIEPLLLGIRGGESIPLLGKARSYIHQASVPMPARYDGHNLLTQLGPDRIFEGSFLESVDPAGPLRTLEGAFGPYAGNSLVNQMLGIDLKLTLADNDLPKVTRMCELAGIDVAFPMLHESVIDLSARLPASLKLNGTRLRYLFKEAMRGFLPPEILAKEKHGFGLPAGLWIHTHPPLAALARDALSSLGRRGIVRADFIESLFAKYVRLHPAYYGTMVWVLMMLEFWLRKRHP